MQHEQHCACTILEANGSVCGKPPLWTSQMCWLAGQPALALCHGRNVGPTWGSPKACRKAEPAKMLDALSTRVRWKAALVTSAAAVSGKLTCRGKLVSDATQIRCVCIDQACLQTLQVHAVSKQLCGARLACMLASKHSDYVPQSRRPLRWPTRQGWTPGWAACQRLLPPAA